MAIVIVALFIAGLVFAAVEEIQSQGKSLVGWAVILIAIGLIIWRLA